MARIVVVGAGLGGLACAVRVAVRGHQVVVCEQADTIGGKLGWFSRDGWSFDTGPQALTLPSVYREVFAASGAPLDDVLDLQPIDPAHRFRFADGVEVDLPNVSRSRIAAAWDEALGGGAGADWASLSERAARIWDVLREPFLSRAQEGPLTLAQARRRGDLRTLAPWRSLRGLGRQYLRHPHQRMVLDRYASYAASDPRRAPATLAILAYVEQSAGVWSVRGGMRGLVEALAERAGERGVGVRTGVDVVQVLQDGSGRATGVRLGDGERLAADVVVTDADAWHVYRDLVGGSDADLARTALRRMTPSSSTFTLLLALRGRTTGPPVHRQVLFPADADDEFDSVFGTGVHRIAGPRPAPDPAIEVFAPDDPALRPDADGEAWFVQVSAPRHVAEGAEDPASSRLLGRPRGIDWAAPGLADRYGDRVLAVMAARGLDVRDRIAWREVRTPADLERRTRSVGGSLHGPSSNTTRSTFIRPANRSSVPGLFLVGGSTHPGGGVPQVGMSAAIVAELIGDA